MKRLLLISVLLLSGLTLRAQTNTPPVVPPSTPQGFLSSALLYFSSINTNYTFSPFKIWTGGDYQNQINFADSINFSYDVLQPASYTQGVAFGAEAGMRNAGIAGTIVSYAAGGNVSYNYYDTRIEGYVDGGYNDPFHKGFAELGARILKKPTANTFLGLGLGFQIPTKGPNYPIASVIAGATF